MNSPELNRPTDKVADHGIPRWLPLGLLLTVVTVLTGRWIWFAGIGDFGWTYEYGMRVLQGEIPYRDFVSTLPQLTSYTIIPFIVALHGSLWSFTIHLYLWWLVSLLVGLKVAQAVGLRPGTQAAAMFFAACLSLPALHLGHAYSYTATAGFGLTLLRLLKFRIEPRPRHLLVAGLWTGLTLFAKQNIGAVTLLLGGGIIAYDAMMRREARAMFWRGLIFGTGVAITFGPVFWYFASHGGGSEVFKQMFSDAGAGKGGVSRMLFNLIPLWFFTPETPHRNLWILAVSGTVFGSFLFLLGTKMSRLRKPALTPVPNEVTKSNIVWLVGLSIAAVTILSAVSLLDLPAVRDFCAGLHPAAMYRFQGYTFPLIFIAYAFFTALTIVSLLNPPHWRQPGLFIPILALALILWGHEMSCEGYLPLGAPLVVPLALLVLEKTGLLRNPMAWACAGGIGIILGLSLSTQREFLAASFKPLEQLPADSKFAGLLGTSTYAAGIAELHHEVAPRIQNQPTLWIHTGGPHQAWGGKPVFGPATMHLDTYNLRAEPGFRAHWTTNPPAFIFVGFQAPAKGSQLFTKEALAQWLPEHYQRVWHSTNQPAELWQFRHQSSSIP